MRKSRSPRHSAASHALALTRLSPGIASKRLAKLSCASPVQAVLMLANLTFEKASVFAQAYSNSLMAIGFAQISLFRLAMASSTPTGALRSSADLMPVLFRSGNEIARTSLAPLAQRVRRNSQ
jgi:hypothetical protein